MRVILANCIIIDCIYLLTQFLNMTFFCNNLYVDRFVHNIVVQLNSRATKVSKTQICKIKIKKK